MHLFSLWFSILTLPSYHVLRPINTSKNLPQNYRIADNLSIPISGSYPSNTQPNWDNVINENSSLANVKRFMIWDENKKFEKFERDELIAIGEFNGKAALYFYGYYACLHAGEIIIPSGNAILSKIPQTFEVRKFEKVYTENNKCDATGPWRQYYDNFSASVTLSTNDTGDIIVSFSINTYSANKELFMKIYANNLLFPLKNSPDKVNNLAKSPYRELANRISTEYHKGWKFDKLFVPNSINNITVMERDKANNPLRVRVECMFDFYGKRDGWFDILLNNSKAYGIIYSIEKYTCINPTKYQGNQPVPYSSAEIASMRRLQMTYLISYMYSLQKARDKTTENCLVPDTHVNLYLEDYNVPSLDLDGNQIMMKSTAIKSTTPMPGLRNSCRTDYYVKGMNRSFVANSITIYDTSIRIPPSKVILEVPIRKQIPYADLLNFDKLCPNLYYR